MASLSVEAAQNDADVSPQATWQPACCLRHGSTGIGPRAACVHAGMLKPRPAVAASMPMSQRPLCIWQAAGPTCDADDDDGAQNVHGDALEDGAQHQQHEAHQDAAEHVGERGLCTCSRGAGQRGSELLPVPVSERSRHRALQPTVVPTGQRGEAPLCLLAPNQLQLLASHANIM